MIVSQASWQLQDDVRQLSIVSGIPTELIEIDYVTNGPAETVDLARSHLDPNMPVITGNSDQYVDADLSPFFRATEDDRVAGSILTMLDTHPKWSYAAVTDDGWVTHLCAHHVVVENTETRDGVSALGSPGVAWQRCWTYLSKQPHLS